ncbi:MAG: dephospho-CoA kinase [Polyangia bacterium]
MPWLLGVTGAIGAGKSTLCALLRRHGYPVLDLDDVAAESLLHVRPFLLRELPAAVGADGGVDKGLVFAAMLRDDTFHGALREALRPLLWQSVRGFRDRLTGPGALDAALLFESGLEALCDATLCVRCPREERRRRVAARPTASARYFEALEAAQWPESAKLARAGITLAGDVPTEQLEHELRAALRALGQAL